MNYYRLLLFIFSLFSSSLLFAQKGEQTTIIPCNITFDFKGEKTLRIGPDTTGKYTIDSFPLSKELPAEKKYNDGIPCVFNYYLSYFIIHLYVSYNVDYDGAYSFLFGNNGMMSLEFYKKENKKLTPLPIDDPGLHVYGMPLTAHTIDSTVTFTVQPLFKIDTGVYMLRAKYRQKCGKQIKTKYTSEVLFRIIN